MGVKGYFASCIDGIFLRFIFCKAIPLKWYLIMMASIDFLLALIDTASLFDRTVTMLRADEYSERLAMMLAMFFFVLKLVFYIPMAFFEFSLIKSNS